MTSSIKSSFLYWAGRFLFLVAFNLIWRRKVIGHENIPEQGGVIIAPNHISLADPPLVGSAMKRPLHFMAKEELFGVPVLGVLIRRTNAFPVKRGRQDLGAFRNVQKLLRCGEAVLVFPEGTRSKSGSPGKARPGIGMIAHLAGVPVVPVRIVNSNRLSGFPRLYVIFGRPIHPGMDGSRESYQLFSEQVLEEIGRLSPEH